MANIFWNLVFLVDLGGVIGLVLVAIERWPGLVNRVSELLTLGACSLVLLFVAGFLWTNVLHPFQRGVWINGIHYEDVWRDE
jgi:hypothetical protein